MHISKSDLVYIVYLFNKLLALQVQIEFNLFFRCFPLYCFVVWIVTRIFPKLFHIQRKLDVSIDDEISDFFFFTFTQKDSHHLSAICSWITEDSSCVLFKLVFYIHRVELKNLALVEQVINFTKVLFPKIQNLMFLEFKFFLKKIKHKLHFGGKFEGSAFSYDN